MRAFMAGIAGIGVLRFLLAIAGLPDSVVKYISMTAIILGGALYFSIATTTHRDRLYASYFLTLPYLVIEVAALGYTWATGHQTIFHSKEYSFGFSIAQHTLGHLVGGLTWEPLTLFLLMELIWAIYTLGNRLLSST